MCLLGAADQGETSKSGLIRGPSLSRSFFFFFKSFLSVYAPPRPPSTQLQFIFQFAPRSSQVCARRKFAEAAGAPSEATCRRDRRVTIGPSAPLLYLPLRLLSPPFPSVPPSLALALSLALCVSVSSGTSLPGYTGPQGDLVLDRVPQHRDPPPSPLPPSPSLPSHSPWGEDGEAIQS